MPWCVWCSFTQTWALVVQKRLIVDAALALKRKGHQVTVFTSHHDHSHCFPETVDGQLEVHCAGDWLPRSTFGKLYALGLIKLEYEVAFVDQVAACIPFLRLKRQSKVVFYCHFPDLLLAMGGEERVGRMARRMANEGTRWKSGTTGQSDCILVNSHFTAGVFKETFKSLKVTPQVVYPSLDFEKFTPFESLSLEDVGLDRILPNIPQNPSSFSPSTALRGRRTYHWPLRHSRSCLRGPG
ncbi:hypothetical protein C7M84_006053 [Penaeus vannamei]|uniref:Alpha-1,3/1,6-mannosyltransferase ALG2 n=1 Tax=Penaeus vannamei TaxID=6689 RepID=A0A3R7M957_PENVA|nr:hypothetical protein C7M84_006053 [Penaeus vannamei]